MVLAGQPEPLAFRLGHNWGATVGADVVERLDFALLGVDEYHGLARLLPLHVTARFRDLVQMRRKQPRLLEDLGLLEFKKSRVGIAACRNIREVGKALCE